MNDVTPEAKAIFLEALDCKGDDELMRFLEKACGTDAALRIRVEELLRAHRDAGAFLGGGEKQDATGDQPLAERPGTVLGPYKLLEQSGEGGFGVVFMAEQHKPVRRKVALKVLKPGMDTRQVVARFEAERQALALMDHPNIAHVFDGGETAGGRPYFVMELVRGIPITEFCDDNQLPVRQRLELFVRVCQAVQHAHQKGIIHRDLKPSNIMVTLHDGTPVVKVIDFGIAKALGQQLTDKTLFTNFAQLMGTPMYMSPEQAQLSGLDMDTRTDIYSLGVLLYELLTGTTPFDAERLRTAAYDEIRRIIREEEPPKPSTRLSTLGEATATVSANRQTDPKRLRQLFRGELDWIVMKALEKDRNRRYDTASAFAADVQRYLHDEPVQACPPSAWYRFRKFARRRKAFLGFTGLVLFFVVLTGSGVGWAVRDRAARDANVARDKEARQARLNFEIEHALGEATRARDQALTLTDNPYRWEAASTSAASVLKRAQGLAAHDETALEPAVRERLEALQAMLEADETDRQFAGRFEDIRLEQSEAHRAVSLFKLETAFTALKKAFQRHYRIEFGATPAEQAVTILQQRPKPMQDLLLAALELSLDNAPKDESQARQWLGAVLDAADTGPWRKRARQALDASDWQAFEQVIEEAAAARQPPSLLIGMGMKTPYGSPISIKVSRRIRQAYPGDFWANYNLAGHLHYRGSQTEEAIRYYTAALALRPGTPETCVDLGNALWKIGDLDGAIGAYRDALDGHPDYAGAHDQLGMALERKGDVDGAVAELRQSIRLVNDAKCHLLLGNVLLRSGRRDEAIESYRKAIALNPKLGTAHYNLGTALSEKKGCLEEAVESYRNAIAWNRRTIELHPSDSDCRNDLAWFLATCAHVQLRDPSEAVKLAEKDVELAPANGSFWNTLGAAHYSARSWKEAVAALEKSMQLSNGGNSYDWFFLAMAHWQLGEKEKACQWFDKAVQWMDKNMPKGRDLGRFRAEAAELLKVEPKKD